MCNPVLFMAAGMGAQAAGARQAAQAQKTSLLYESQVANNNAQIAEYQAQGAEAQARAAEGQARDATVYGGIREQAVRMQSAALKSSQRTALAANGVDVREGSANDILTSTDYMTALDVNAVGMDTRSAVMDAYTARDNALKNAWGYRTQGAGYKDAAANSRASAATVSPNRSALLSLIGNSGQVANTWYNMNKAGA